MSGVEQTIPFAMIPRAFIEDRRTKAYHLAAFAALSSFANRSGECWPGVDKTRQLAGIGKNKWPDVLRELQEWGWIQVIHRHTEDGRQLSNKYRLHGRPTQIREGEGFETVTHSPPKKGDEQEPLEQEPDNNILDTFESIWGEYPNKVGKHQALANYRKALRHHSPQDLLQAVRNYSESVAGRDKVYIKTGGNFFSKGFYPDYLPGQYGQTEPPAMREYEGEL